jgi:hypothetical protein
MNNLLIWHGEGKALISRLHDATSKPIPRVDWELRDVLRQMIDLVISVQDGISAMEGVIAIHKIFAVDF